MQEWILRMRQRGLAVLLVHHSGKSGEQRGASRRDVLDTVIGLRRPVDYELQQGARFEVHVEKSRAYFGDAGRPFEASLASTPDGRGLTWLACESHCRNCCSQSHQFCRIVVFMCWGVAKLGCGPGGAAEAVVLANARAEFGFYTLILTRTAPWILEPSATELYVNRICTSLPSSLRIA
jgi:hypothetical protein